MLNQFGEIVEVFIDQGMKFCGEFQKWCQKTLINLHMTSQNHLKVDGLIEWMV